MSDPPSVHRRRRKSLGSGSTRKKRKSRRKPRNRKTRKRKTRTRKNRPKDRSNIQVQSSTPDPLQPRIDSSYIEHTKNETKQKKRGFWGLFAKKSKTELPKDSFGSNAVYGTQEVSNSETGSTTKRAIHGPANWQQFYPTWKEVGQNHLKPVDTSATRVPMIKEQMHYLKKKGITIIEPMDWAERVWKVKAKYLTKNNRKKSGTVEAVMKVISLRDFDKSKQIMISVAQAVSDMFNEIRILEQLKHQNVVRIRRIIEIPDIETQFPYSAICLLMSYCDGSLLSTLQETGHMVEGECLLWFLQIVEGLKYLHNQNVVHMNIKPSNILFVLNQKSRSVFKLSDFSQSIKFTEGMPTTSGIKRDDIFMAPEVRGQGPQVKQYETKPADIYSLCVTLVVSLIGVEADPNAMLNDLRQREWKNMRARQYMMAPISKNMTDLMTRISEINPKDRITIEEVCNHRWVRG